MYSDPLWPAGRRQRHSGGYSGGGDRARPHCHRRPLPGEHPERDGAGQAGQGLRRPGRARARRADHPDAARAAGAAGLREAAASWTASRAPSTRRRRSTTALKRAGTGRRQGALHQRAAKKSCRAAWPAAGHAASAVPSTTSSHSPPKVEGPLRPVRRRALSAGRRQAGDRSGTAWRVYNQQTAPLIEYYPGQGKLVEVNGEQGADAVGQDLLKAAGL